MEKVLEYCYGGADGLKYKKKGGDERVAAWGYFGQQLPGYWIQDIDSGD